MITVDQILELYKGGSYGTPVAPVRSSSLKSVFWLVYLGHRKASEFKNSIMYAAACAGAKAAKLEI